MSSKIGASECCWGNVHDVLNKMNLSVAGGRASNGGIGRYAREGGLSFFSSSKGFIRDNVINFEMVLSNGMIINANATEHNDLFTALKGGSNIFGAVSHKL